MVEINLNNIERICPYIIDKKGNVYKFVKNKSYFLKVTPWKQGEDRRKTIDEVRHLLNSDKAHPEKNKNKIFELLNDIWDQTYDSWEHNGITYQSIPNYESGIKINYSDIPYHQFGNKQYKIGYCCGELVWVELGGYLPRVKLFNFCDENTEPNRLNWRWTKINHIRPILNKNSKKYI